MGDKEKIIKPPLWNIKKPTKVFSFFHDNKVGQQLTLATAEQRAPPAAIAAGGGPAMQGEVPGVALQVMAGKRDREETYSGAVTSSGRRYNADGSLQLEEPSGQLEIVIVNSNKRSRMSRKKFNIPYKGEKEDNPYEESAEAMKEKFYLKHLKTQKKLAPNQKAWLKKICKVNAAVVVPAVSASDEITQPQAKLAVESLPTTSEPKIKYKSGRTYPNLYPAPDGKEEPEVVVSENTEKENHQEIQKAVHMSMKAKSSFSEAFDTLVKDKHIDVEEETDEIYQMTRYELPTIQPRQFQLPDGRLWSIEKKKWYYPRKEDIRVFFESKSKGQNPEPPVDYLAQFDKMYGIHTSAYSNHGAMFVKRWAVNHKQEIDDWMKDYQDYIDEMDKVPCTAPLNVDPEMYEKFKSDTEVVDNITDEQYEYLLKMAFFQDVAAKIAAELEGRESWSHPELFSREFEEWKQRSVTKN